jgi:hypothetical protein
VLIDIELEKYQARNEKYRDKDGLTDERDGACVPAYTELIIQYAISANESTKR